MNESELKSAAEKVVNFLLEDGPEKVCYECEREFGLSPNNTNSTGALCKRHLANRYRKMNRPTEAKRIEEMPDARFAPDLSKSKNIGSRAMHPNATSDFQQRGNAFFDKVFGTRT